MVAVLTPWSTYCVRCGHCSAMGGEGQAESSSKSDGGSLYTPPLEAHQHPSHLAFALKTWKLTLGLLPSPCQLSASSNRSNPTLPQGLCTCSSLCLDQHPGLLISQVPAQTSPPQVGLP